MRSAFAVFLRGFTLPFGASTGRRIVFDGVNGTIEFYDSSNDLRLALSILNPSEIQFFTADAAETLAGRIRAITAVFGGKTHLNTRVSSPSTDAGGSVAATVELRSRSTDATTPPMIALKATVSTDDLSLGILDNSSGTRNQPMGTAVLVAGTVTVNHSWVTANSRIILWRQVAGGTLGHLSVGTITAGTSFVINSSSATDTSTIGYLVVEPL